MIIGKNLVPETFAPGRDAFVGGFGKLVNTDRFPLSNVQNESAAASVFIEIPAGQTANVDAYPSSRETADYEGMRGHPLLGYDEKLRDGRITADFYRGTSPFFPTIDLEFGSYDIFIKTDGRGGFFRFTNTTAEPQILRLDDFFAFNDIEVGRNINRAFDFPNVQRSRTLTNEFGATAVIQRNITREVNVSLSLLRKEQAEKIRLFLTELRENPFMAIFDPKAVATTNPAILSGKFFVPGTITPKHTFGEFWSLKFRAREHV